MIKPFKKQALLPVIAMFVYSGCAKEPLATNDNPLGGHLPNVAQTQTAPVNPMVKAEQKKSLVPAASSASIPVKEETLLTANGTESATVATSLQTALEKIYFDFDSSDLSAAARQKLVETYQLLQKNAAIKIRIEGNCDERGSDEYNLALGEQRSRAAARYLMTLGITAVRLSTISFGEEKPAASGHDETAWAKNRRDEFVITSR